jgi:hypothetical protein
VVLDACLRYHHDRRPTHGSTSARGPNAAASVCASEPLVGRIKNLRTGRLLLYGRGVNDGRTCGLLLYGRRVNKGRTCGLLLYGGHIGGLAASVGAPHIFLDAALNRTTALLFKVKAGTNVALAGRGAIDEVGQ